MSAHPSANVPSFFAALGSVVGVTLPAAFLTMLADSIGKEPSGPLLYVGVIAVPSLLGLVASRVALLSDPNGPKYAFGPAVTVSLGASLLAFVAALVWFIP